MIIKLGYVDSYINGLQQLAAKKLPVKLSYMIAANLKILTEKREDIEKQRIKILTENCLKDEKGKPLLKKIETSGDNKDEIDDNDDKNAKYKYTYASDDLELEAIERCRELFEIEEEIDIKTIPFDDIEKCETEKYDLLNGYEIEAMLFMIKE